MKPEIVLIGGGGHCKSCIDVIEQDGTFDIVGIVDVKEKLHQNVFGYEIIAEDSELYELVHKFENFILTIGQLTHPSRRIEIFKSLKTMGAKLPTIISPFAYVSKHANLGEGTIVMHDALINAGASVGHNCIINTKALIEHDVVIENHCHIATGAVINGGTNIGQETFIGSNAVIRECISIGEKSIVGAGSVITSRLSPESIIIGKT